MTLSDIQTAGGAAVLVTILVQLLKAWIPERAVPAASVGLGVLVCVAAAVALGARDVEALGNAILTGVLAGASGVGLYQIQRPVRLLSPKEPQ